MTSISFNFHSFNDEGELSEGQYTAFRADLERLAIDSGLTVEDILNGVILLSQKFKADRDEAKKLCREAPKMEYQPEYYTKKTITHREFIREEEKIIRDFLNL